VKLKAPFPWFGGKSKVARIVWDHFGIVQNYVEPFFGSGAVLLGRPSQPGTETVNDLDCYLANFWRALSFDAGGITESADWPVNEADLHARHLWLVNQSEFREKMKTDPDFFDSRIAGWWVWGISQWIGSGWCSRPEWLSMESVVSRVHQKLPNMGDDGRGVHRPSQQIPDLSGDSGASGRGIFSAAVAGKRPHLYGRGTGIGIHGDESSKNLYAYMCALASRLRRVRVCCGSWDRVLGPSVTVKHGVCGVFLDPPYDMRLVSSPEDRQPDRLYSNHDNDLSKDVRAWAVENGDNPLLRIALCGYEGEHEFPSSWECVPWKAHGGYGSQRGDRGYENAARERIWFSPHCIKTLKLFPDQELIG
jgi:D12 class N6 adenine-specific DNA methyltransferase